MNKQLETATLGGGCFWCIEAILRRLRGVETVTSGYSGGDSRSATYEAVSSGLSGHAEVVQLTFDPTVITFSKILEVFFHLHDPTTRNAQGNDVGPQYRSVIFYHSDQQKLDAENVVAAVTAARLWQRPIVTEISPFKEFFAAEDYHQRYFENNRAQPYCSIVIAPKIQKLLKEFSALLKPATLPL